MKTLLIVDESIRLGLEMVVKPFFWSDQMISLYVSIEAGEAPDRVVRALPADGGTDNARIMASIGETLLGLGFSQWGRHRRGIFSKSPIVDSAGFPMVIAKLTFGNLP